MDPSTFYAQLTGQAAPDVGDEGVSGGGPVADSNWGQTNFLGGEWSPFAQGRVDLPQYRTAMNVCLNSLPLQEGPWARRPGFLNFGSTYSGNPGIIRPFIRAGNLPCFIEIAYAGGGSVVRFWVPDSTQTVFVPFYDSSRTISSISTADPALVTVSATEGWSTADQVYFSIAASDGYAAAGILNSARQFIMTAVSSTTFTIKDSATGDNVNGALLGYTAGSDTVNHILTIDLPYTTLAQVQALRITQTDDLLILESADFPSKSIIWTGSTFTFQDAGYQNWDGPYLDPPPGASQQNASIATISAWPTDGGDTATVTITDGGYTFTADDVGKPIRLFEQPPAWDPNHDYYGDASPWGLVTYQGSYWKLVPGSDFNMPTGTAPGTSYPIGKDGNNTIFVPWVPSPDAAGWQVGYISAYTSGTEVTVTFPGAIFVPPALFDEPDADGASTTIEEYQIGAYGPTGYPTTGAYHEGRLWLAGAIQNRIDGSISDAVSPDKVGGGLIPADAFSPTDVYGNVGDANAVAATFNDAELNEIFWIVPISQGMIIGTAGGEFLVTASNLNDPLTPASMQAHKITKYKAANIEPRLVGSALLFVQAFGRRIMEYFADAFTGKFLARHLNEYAGHLTQAGIAEIWYQEERTPVLWVRLTDDTLVGCTYRRFSSFSSEPALFTGWHRHLHGMGHTFESMCVGTDPSGELDCLMAITNDPNTSIRHVEMMTPIFEEEYLLPQAMHIDGGYVGYAGSDAGGGYYFEVTINTAYAEADVCIGVANSSFNLSNPVALDETAGVYSGLNGGAFIANAPAASTGWSGEPGTAPDAFGNVNLVGDTIGVAVNTNGQIWFSNSTAPGVWIGSGSGSANPTYGIGGYALTSAGITAGSELFILVGAGRDPSTAALDQQYAYSNSNLTATATLTNSTDTALGTLTRTTGKYYFEFTTTSSGGPDLVWGIAKSTQTNSGLLGSGSAGLGWRSNGNWRIGGSEGVSGMSAPSSGQVIGIAVDLTNSLIWIRNVTASSTTWYGANSGTPNPATGTEGFSFSSFSAAMYLCFSSNQNSTTPAVTMNAGGSSFAATAPTGFSAWNASDAWNTSFTRPNLYPSLTLNTGASTFAMTPPTNFDPWDTSGGTTINPSDKSANVTLSGGNLALTVLSTTGSNQPSAFARSTTAKI